MLLCRVSRGYCPEAAERCPTQRKKTSFCVEVVCCGWWGGGGSSYLSEMFAGRTTPTTTPGPPPGKKCFNHNFSGGRKTPPPLPDRPVPAVTPHVGQALVGLAVATISCPPHSSHKIAMTDISVSATLIRFTSRLPAATVVVGGSRGHH